MAVSEMQRQVKRGETFDVSTCKRTPEGYYILPRRMHPPKRKEPKDYCDLETKTWIWSIGKHRVTGLVLASTTANFYQRRGWECLWLR